MTVREIERVHRRVFGAVRLVDGSTGSAIRTPIRVQSDTVELTTNRSGLIVVTGVRDGVASTILTEDERSQFEPDNVYQIVQGPEPLVPAADTLDFELTITDPSLAYLPRRCRLRLAIAPDDTPLQPFERRLLPGPLLRPGVADAVVRVHVTTGGVALPGVLVLVLVRDTTDVLARGMTNDAGDAVVPVPGLPETTFTDLDDDGEDDDAVPGSTAVDVLFRFDPSTWNGTALTAVPEPDLLEAAAGLTEQTVPLSLAPGQTVQLADVAL